MNAILQYIKFNTPLIATQYVLHTKNKHTYVQISTLIFPIQFFMVP